MKRSLLVLLLPLLSVAGCADWFNAPDPAGAEPAAAPATAIPVDTVTGFDGLTWNGSVLGTWMQSGPSRWSVRNINTGETVTVRESRRSDCCIHFDENDGSTMVADFWTMEVHFGGNTLTIGGVTY